MVNEFPDSKVHGANMGPIWGRQGPGGPHVGPMNLAIWVCLMGGFTTQSVSNEKLSRFTTQESVMQNFDKFDIFRWNKWFNKNYWLVDLKLHNHTLDHHHFSDTTWYQYCLKSLATWLFVQQLVRVNNNKNIKAPHHWFFARGIHLSSVDAPHRRPVMQTAFICNDVIMARNVL